MQISVVISSYNRPELLKKAVISAYYHQPLSPFEVILIDNGSEYDIREVLRDEILKYKSLRITSLKENVPFIGDVYNKALGIVRGDSVIFLSDDCELVPGSLKLLADNIGNGSFVTGLVNTLLYPSRATLTNLFGSRKWNRGRAERYSLMHLSATLIKTDVFNSLGGFDPRMRKGFTLDFFNRMFSVEHNKVYKIVPALISRVLVGTPDSLTAGGREPVLSVLDLYPMKNYWEDRKSFSIVSDDQDFINLFNSRDNAFRQPWVGTTKQQDADVVMSWAYTEELASNINSAKLYYLDYFGLEESKMAELCDGYVTQFPIEKIKPTFVLRPTLTVNTMDWVDRHYPKTPKPDGLRILCMNIDENNLDFLYVLLDHVCLEFNKVTLIYKENREATFLLREIPKLRKEIIKSESYTSLKDTRPTVILGLAPDENDYVQSHKDFTLSGILQVPLVSTINKGFDGMLREDVDYYNAVSIQDFIRYFKVALLSDGVGREARVTLNTHYREDTVYNTFIYYLNNIYNAKVRTQEDGFSTTQKVAQLRHNTSIPLGTGYFTQKISKGVVFSNTLDIDLFIKVLSNIEADIEVSIFNDLGVIKGTQTIPSYKIKNGMNTFSFGVACIGDLITSFSLRSTLPFCALQAVDSVQYEGYLRIGDKPSKSSLKFIVRDTVY